MKSCKYEVEEMSDQELSPIRHSKGTGKKRIEIKAIENKNQRMVTFSKRREGLYRKAVQLNNIVGFSFAIIVFSPTGRIYIRGNPSCDDVLQNYLQDVKKNKADKEEETKENDFDMWLDGIKLGECDNINEIVNLKGTLRLMADKVEEKLLEFSDLKIEEALPESGSTDNSEAAPNDPIALN